MLGASGAANSSRAAAPTHVQPFGHFCHRRVSPEFPVNASNLEHLSESVVWTRSTLHSDFPLPFRVVARQLT